MVMTLLETYTLEEILDISDITEEELVSHLIECGLIDIELLPHILDPESELTNNYSTKDDYNS